MSRRKRKENDDDGQRQKKKKITNSLTKTLLKAIQKLSGMTNGESGGDNSYFTESIFSNTDFMMM